MKGTEKQIEWATDIKDTLKNTWEEMKNLFMNDPQYDSANPQHREIASKFDKNIMALEFLDAYDIIDIFSRIDKEEPAIKRYKSIVANLVVTTNPKSKLFIK